MKGCKAIAVDILMFGSGEPEKKAREDHDVDFLNLLQRRREKNVKLNGEKVQLRCRGVSYMGHCLFGCLIKLPEVTILCIFAKRNKTKIALILNVSSSNF